MNSVRQSFPALLLTATLMPAAGMAQSTDEQAIRDLEQQWAEAVARKDSAAIADLFANDGQVMPSNAPAARGPEGARQTWEQFLNLPEFDLTFAPDVVEVAGSGDMAYVIGTYELSFQGPEGAVEDQGKYLDVWEKVDGQWKVKAEIFNSDLPLE